ncbi:MAG TPA: RNA polymerase sigma factor [Oculatellaceae cyanobacterium]
MKAIGTPLHKNFEAYTYEFLEPLYRLAYARTGNAHDAEDILQETYLKAFRAFATLKDLSRVKSWLTQIMLRTIQDHRKRAARMVPLVEMTDIEEANLPSNGQTPEERLCSEEIDPDLLRALQAVPEIYLTPLLLREVYDATYEEIAQILDIPKGTVMSRLSRARGMLRKSLRPEPGLVTAKLRCTEP